MVETLALAYLNTVSPLSTLDILLQNYYRVASCAQYCPFLLTNFNPRSSTIGKLGLDLARAMHNRSSILIDRLDPFRLLK